MTHGNVDPGSVPERRVRVEQQSRVTVDTGVVAEPALLKVPHSFVALAGEDDDEPLDHCQTCKRGIPTPATRSGAGWPR